MKRWLSLFALILTLIVTSACIPKISTPPSIPTPPPVPTPPREAPPEPKKVEVSPIPKVAFTVVVPAVMPEEDDIYIQGTDFPSTKMTRVNRTTWKAEILVPPNKDVYYFYHRNNVGYEASEEIMPGDTPQDLFKRRSIKAVPFQNVEQFDEIKKWRWLLNEPLRVEIPAESRQFLPRIQGWKFQKGIGVIDYWWNVFFDNRETEHTVKRIIADRANYVQYSPTWAFKITDETIELDKESSYCYPEKAIRYETSKAKEAGLRVIFRNQVWMDLPSEIIKKERPKEWWEQYYKVRREYLMSMARLAQEMGVEAMNIGTDYDTLLAFTTWGSAPAESYSKWLEDIQEVKKIFKGKIYYDFTPPQKFQDTFSIDMKRWQPILNEVDFIGISWWKGISDKDNPTLKELEKNAADQFDRYLKSIYEATGKPIVLNGIAFASADGGSTGKYAWNSRAVDIWKPADDTFNDYQEQAEVYEAVMRTVAARPWIVGIYPFGFWRHDQQDKGFNIRGKPAENVLKSWYSQIAD